MTINFQKSVDNLKKYSEALSLDKPTYISRRNHLLRSFIGGRKKMRDLNWYIKRLNIYTALMFCSMYNNKRLYRNHLLKYIIK